MKEHRLAKGLSQAELALAAGISRAGLSAIEVERLLPSVATALALAHALNTSVETLFGQPAATTEPAWALTPAGFPCRFWAAEVNARTMLYPLEPANGSFHRQDGAAHRADFPTVPPDIARRTLVIATCDPAAGYLALEYERQSPFRLLVLRRSSRDGLDLLKRGLVHAAGIHFAESDSATGNQQAIEREGFPFDVEVLALVKWEEGIAHAQGIKLSTARQATASRLRWIGRSPGTGARGCQDEVLGERRAPRHVARDHADVVASIRSGFVDAGICVRLVAEESRVNFLRIRDEDYDLCLPRASAADPRVAALLAVVRSPQYRETIAELPGYRLRPAEETVVAARKPPQKLAKEQP